jgi:oligopeptide/dipeptide ABC transporter ATP-binding protein
VKPPSDSPFPLLEIRDLVIEFGPADRVVRVVDGVSLQVRSGETVALVGESGSGKTLTALAVARLLPSGARIAGGEIKLGGEDLRRMSPRELRRVRGGRVAYVFQEPASALNPAMRVGDQVMEVLRLHRREAATAAEVVQSLTDVGLAAPAERARDYPHQLSGGMQQRVMIAMALASRPRLLIADEPTTALDVTIQAQILDLLRDLRRRYGMSILLITHHLGIVAEFADRVAVMYAGQVVEQGRTEPLLARPRHPYTRALLNAVPRLGGRGRRLEGIPGQVPAAGGWPEGCRFHPRCGLVRDDCRRRLPGLAELGPDESVRCPWWQTGGG